MSYIWANGDQCDVAAGYADVDNGIRMPVKARMHGASTGKMWHALHTLSWILGGERDMGLDDKISKFVADEYWYQMLPNNENITIRHLLNMASGLTSYYEEAPFAKWNTDPSRLQDPYYGLYMWELLSYSFNRIPAFPAGGGYAYSENGYELLAMIKEKLLGGKISPTFVNSTYLIQKNGVLIKGEAANRANWYANSKYYNDFEKMVRRINLPNVSLSSEFCPPGLVMGFSGGKLAPYRRVLDDYGCWKLMPGIEVPGGGLITTSSSLAQFLRLYVTGKALPGIEYIHLFSPKEMNRAPFGYYGWGVNYMEHPQFGPMYFHTGLIPGYLSFVGHVINSSLTVAIQVNSDEVNLRPLVDATLAAILNIN